MSEIEPVNPSSSKPDDGAAIASKSCFIGPRITSKSNHAQPKFISILVLSFQVTLLFVASASILYGLFYWRSPIFSSASHPAQIPWLVTQDSCEQTGRTWKQDQCLDYSHNPLF